jgi:hypothetical protein
MSRANRLAVPTRTAHAISLDASQHGGEAGTLMHGIPTLRISLPGPSIWSDAASPVPEFDGRTIKHVRRWLTIRAETRYLGLRAAALHRTGEADAGLSSRERSGTVAKKAAAFGYCEALLSRPTVPVFC